MKILYISNYFFAPDLALRMKNEGHEVFVALKDPNDILKGTLKRIDFDKRFQFIKSLDKDKDLIVYDDKVEGEPADIRKYGYSVIGGCKKTDKSELDRLFSNKVAETCGMLVPDVHKLDSLDEIQAFIKEHPGK